MAADLAPLAAMTILEDLGMTNCTSVSDLTPLGALANMLTLDVCDCNADLDLTPLEALTSLEHLYSGNPDGYSEGGDEDGVGQCFFN
jgi:hypothetical protein